MKYNRINITQLVIYLIFILSIFSSCGILKKSIKNTKNLNEKSVQNNEVYITIDSIKSNYLNFETFFSGFNGKFEKNGKSIPLKGIIKIKKDTFIQISIRPTLGIELAKILLTKDSIKILDKIKKQFIKEDYLYLQKMFGIDINYKIIQSIFLNRFFIYPTHNNINSYKLNFLENKNIFKITSNADFLGKNVKHEVKLVQNNFYIKYNDISFFNSNRYINVLYSGFNEIKNKKFPKNIEIKLSENLIKIRINVEYKNIKLNKSLKCNFVIPKNYKAVKFE